MYGVRYNMSPTDSDSDNILFDVENRNEVLDYKQVILRQIYKITTDRNKNLGTFIKYGANPDSTEKANIQFNNLEIFCNSVEMLQTLLIIYYDEEYEDRLVDIKELIHKKVLAKVKLNHPHDFNRRRDYDKSYDTFKTYTLLEEFDLKFKACMQLLKRRNFFSINEAGGAKL